MKKSFLNGFVFVIFTLLALNPAQAQDNQVSFCGANFTVYCDGTVDVQLSENVNIYKVYKATSQGAQEIVQFNNFDANIPNVPTSLFNSGQAGAVIPDGDIYFAYLSTTCGDFTINFSEIIAEVCPPVETFCGATFETNCDGTIDVQLSEQVQIYKVYSSNPQGEVTLIVEFNNYVNGIPDVPLMPFNSGDPGNPIPFNGNYFVYLGTDCGDYFINFSEILSMYCSDYAPSSPAYQGLQFIEGVSLTDESKGINNTPDWDNNLNISSPVDARALENITVYPNPSSSQVNVSLPATEGAYTIEIFDLSGQLMRTMLNSGDSNVNIDLSDFNTGLYVLKVQSKSLNYTEKIQVIK